MKPTKGQTKRFWEWCGFQKIENPTADLGWIYSAPDKNYLSLKGYPEIDLDHLGLIFKYAMPKLSHHWDMWIESWVDQPNMFIARFQTHTGEFIKFIETEIIETDKNPALALFWAIYKIIEEETET